MDKEFIPSFQIRVAAFIIDVFLLGVPIYLLSINYLDVIRLFPEAELLVKLTHPSYIVFVCCFVLTLGIFNIALGSSIGKKMLYLKIANSRGIKKAGWFKRFLRGVFFVIYFVCPPLIAISAIMVFFRMDGKSLLDFLTGTMIISSDTNLGAGAK